MPRLIWANFDAEHELAGDPAGAESGKLAKHNARLARALRFLAKPGDRIVVPFLPATDSEAPFVTCAEAETSDEFAGAEWSVVPWMVTESLREVALRRGWSWHHPDPAVVKECNDRLTSFAWEEKTQTLPDGARLIASVDELKQARSGGAGTEWYLKARFGMSGRERIHIRQRLTANQIGWIEKRLARQKQLILEPRLEAIAEAGLQFQIPESGPPEFLDALLLISSAQGAYVGSRYLLVPQDRVVWESAIDAATRVAANFQSRGYFGPLGVDSMIYLREGDLHLRPLQDINARWTMGRVAWEARSQLPRRTMEFLLDEQV